MKGFFSNSSNTRLFDKGVICFHGDGFSTNGKVAVRSGLMVVVYTIHSAWWHGSGTVQQS